MALVKWNVGSGNWNLSSSWDTGSVPGSSDDAIIALPGSYTVSITSPISIGSVSITNTSASLAINDSGHTEVVTGDFTNGGSLLLDRFGGQGGSHLSVGGTLTNSNLLQIGNTGLSAADDVTAAGLVNTGRICCRAARPIRGR